MEYRVAYISNKQFLMLSMLFSLMELVGQMTHVTTFGRSLGIMSTARPELPYPCISKTKSRVKKFQRGKLCDYKVSRV